jgi:cytochrome c-type biogenesis protein CcmF
MMIVEIGHFALVLALGAAFIQTVAPFWGARVGDDGLMGVGRSAALTQLALIAVAFAALVNAHLTSDFSVLNVAENSNVAMPAIYKISGEWGTTKDRCCYGFSFWRSSARSSPCWPRAAARLTR